jgi:hypothetical protein
LIGRQFPVAAEGRIELSKQRLWSVGLAALSLAAVSMSARAQEKRAPPAPVSGWSEFVESLRTLPERMLAKLPEQMRADPQVQQEIGRLALEALALVLIIERTGFAFNSQALGYQQQMAEAVCDRDRTRPAAPFEHSLREAEYMYLFTADTAAGPFLLGE